MKYKILLLFLLLIVTISCKNDIDFLDTKITEECKKDSDLVFGKLSKAETAYANNPNVENCKQLKITINSLLVIAKKCSFLKPSEREGYQDRVSNLDCN